MAAGFSGKGKYPGVWSSPLVDHLFIHLSFGVGLLLKIMIGIYIALQFVRYIERIEYFTF